MRTELHFYRMEINACCFVTFGKLRTGETVSTNRFFWWIKSCCQNLRHHRTCLDMRVHICILILLLEKFCIFSGFYRHSCEPLLQDLFVSSQLSNNGY